MPTLDPAAAYRYEISALIEPCSQEEAEAMLEAVAVEHGDRLDACWSIRRWDEEIERAFDALRPVLRG